MRIVALVLVGVALIGGAFGLGRVTRASADDPPAPKALSTPVPLEPGQPVTAAGPSEAASLPALRPAPKPKKKKPKKSTPPRTTTTTAGPAPTAAPTSAPASPQPSTPAPSTPKPKPKTPVEEIG
jgi:cytoskeletal protein RodZ